MMMNLGIRCFIGSILWFLLMAVSPVQLLCAQSTDAPEVLTNDKVVEMVRAHLGAAVIVEQIRSSPGNYSLNSSSLIKLRQQGVPDEVISAMQAKRSGGASDANGAAEAPKTKLSCKTQGAWELEKDGGAYTCERTKGSQQPGELQITASCSGAALDFEIVYLSDEKPAIGLKQEWYGAITLPFVHHTKPWVEMDLGIDEQGRTKITSESDYTNYAHMRFLEGANPTQSLLGLASVMTGGLSNNPLSKVLKARSISLELTTQNGVKHTLEIKPQDPAFQRFASRCRFMGYEPTIHETGSDSFAPLKSIPIRERNWEGTAQEFAVQFPNFMQRAVTASGLPPNYKEEMAYIVNAVKTCAEITPEMAKSVAVPQPNGQIVEDIARLGAQYKVCGQHGVPDVSKQMGTAGAGGRAIVLGISPASFRSPGTKWQDGKGFQVGVSFAPAKGDPQLIGRYDPADYTIMSAVIHPADLAGGRVTPPAQQGQMTPGIPAQPPPAGPDGFKPLGASVPMASREFSGTAERFAAALPGFVRQAAAASGLPLHDYDKEIAFIVEAVRSCEQLVAGTPQATGQPCGAGYRAVPREGAPPGERTLVLQTNVKDGGLVVNVLFKGIRGDPGPRVRPKTQAEVSAAIADDYRIVSADILK